MWPRKVPTLEPNWEDAKFAVQEYGNWIKNADTKITILAGASGVLLTFLASKLPSAYVVVREGEPAEAAMMIVVIISLLVVGTVMARWIYIALRPRTPVSLPQNRFSWPAMASLSAAPNGFSPFTLIEEAWDQAFVLSKIAYAKYFAFNRAIEWFAVLVVLGAGYVAWSGWRFS